MIINSTKRLVTYILIFISICGLSFYLVEHSSGWYFSIFLITVGLSNFIFERDEKIGSSKDYIREKKIEEILK